MKKIVLVSSFSDSCGNAFFSRILVDQMREQGIDAVPGELNLRFTQAISKQLRKQANLHIDQLCEQIAQADGANLQIEPALYGSLPGDMRRRIIALAKANKHVSATIHSPRFVADAISEREFIRALIRGRLKTACKSYLQQKRMSIHYNLNRDVVRDLCKENIALIVHTERAKRQIKSFFGYDNVHVHPIKMLADDYQVDRSLFNQLKTRIGATPDDVFVGMFGFVNEYKGHTDAINALKHLPSNYKLLIFGRQHPQTIAQNQLVHPYLQSLQELVEKNKLVERVFFMGEYETPDFVNLAGSVDVVWMPYTENGQDGSGVASICFDVARNMLCSASFAFDELLKLLPYKNAQRFDIGNVLELASKTQMAMRIDNQSLTHDTSQFKYNMSTQTALYIQKSLGI